jgi:hypothetical protein
LTEEEGGDLIGVNFRTHAISDFSRDLENLSPNLSPALEKALNSPPSLAP